MNWIFQFFRLTSDNLAFKIEITGPHVIMSNIPYHEPVQLNGTVSTQKAEKCQVSQQQLLENLIDLSFYSTEIPKWFAVLTAHSPSSIAGHRESSLLLMYRYFQSIMKL